MTEIILYPTDTIYDLGVNAFDEEARKKLSELKGRKEVQMVSLLVRNKADIERFAVVTPAAEDLIDQYLPGPLTIGLEPKDTVPQWFRSMQELISFRISPDPVTAKFIAEYMENNDGVPLTCTSANIHGQPTMPTPDEILAHFGEKAKYITRVIDGGSRSGVSSTVVECVGDSVEVIREGAIKLK